MQLSRLLRLVPAASTIGLYCVSLANFGTAMTDKATSNGPDAPRSILGEPITKGEQRGSFWLLLLSGSLMIGVVAVLVAWRLHVLPFHSSAAVPPAMAPKKLLVRYVVVPPHETGTRPAGPSYIAEVRGDSELSLSFEVGGVVDLIGPTRAKTWDVGTPVPAGAVLARLKPDDFVNRVKGAQSRADLAQLNYQRFKNLVESQSVPKAQFDQAAAEKKAADAELAAAQQALKETVLEAPLDGAVLGVMVNPAETVAPGRPVLRFSNLRRMSVEVGVPDTTVGQVRVGQEVPVVFSALAGQSFLGRVAEVGAAGEEGSRLFKVKIKVENPDGKIKSGMTASVSFAPAGRLPVDAVWAPLAALTAAAQGKLAVWAIDADGKARQRPVQTDEIAGNQILVTSGLKPGDKVVVTGVSLVFDGAMLDAQPASESFN